MRIGISHTLSRRRRAWVGGKGHCGAYGFSLANMVVFRGGSKASTFRSKTQRATEEEQLLPLNHSCWLCACFSDPQCDEYLMVVLGSTYEYVVIRRLSYRLTPLVGGAEADWHVRNSPERPGRACQCPVHPHQAHNAARQTSLRGFRRRG